MRRLAPAALSLLLLVTGGAAAGVSEVAPRIAFAASRAGDVYSVFTVRGDGSGRRQVAAVYTYAEGARTAWSGDGRRVAFSSDQGALAVANGDGSGFRHVGTGFERGFDDNIREGASWSPDGHTVVVPAEFYLWLFDIESGAITQTAASGYRPSFSPDGRLIAFLGPALQVMNADGTDIRRLHAAGQGREDDDFESAPPSWSPDSQRITFEYRGEVLVYDLRSGRASNVTRTPGRVETAPSWSPDGRWIAFVRGAPTGPRDVRTGVSIVRPGGSGLRVLTDERFLESSPVWSPDSRRLAFLGGSNDYRGASAAYVVGIGGGRARRLFEGPCGKPERISGLSWGRAGQIAFASDIGSDDLQLYSARTDLSDVRRLAGSCADEWAPAWSPDGHRIAYGRDQELWAMAGDGSGKRRLARGVLPAWSPDGQQIVFSRGSRETSQLYRIAFSGGSERQLTHGVASWGPDWSRAAGRIAFTRALREQGEVMTMAPDGSDVRRVTRGGGRDPAWSPDGARIAYVYGPNIWTIGADGQGAVQVTRYDECTDVSDPAWSPDGRTIGFGFYSADYEHGGIAFVPATGGEVELLRYDPRIGALGEDNSEAPPYSWLAWHPAGQSSTRTLASRLGPATTKRCIRTE